MKTTTRCALLLALVCSGLVTAQAQNSSGAKADAANASWKIHQTVRASYPPRMIYKGVTHGEARVRVSISASGQLLDALIVASSHRDFGEEALRTVKTWSYDPEKVNGEAIGIVGDITFVFAVDGPVAIDKKFPAPNEPADDFPESTAYKPEGFKQLDRIPTPTQVVAPLYPTEWSDRGVAGSVTVEFFIDETGKARIPVVTAADHHLLGASAVAAVAQWRFEPPTRKGQPVLARAEQVFTFQPSKK